MRCCSSSFQLASLLHWRRPRLDMSSREWEGAQVLYKVVSEAPLGLTKVEEATLGAADAVNHISGCVDEHLSDVEGFFGSLDGGERA
eukprot:g16290.t1